MKAEYKRLGDYIRLVDVRNREQKVSRLVGLTIDKSFIPSVANTIGTDISNYKIIRKKQFACSLMQVSRDGKMPVAMFEEEEAIMSPAYPMFEVHSSDLMPDYLMLWFLRPEFDREASFYAVGGVRGSLEWNDFCDMMLPVPPIEEQRRIVEQYQTVERRIKNNERLIALLEDTAQTIFRHRFVDNIDPNNLPEGWRMGTLSDIASITMGQSPDGESLNEENEGYIFYQGRTDFGFRFPSVRTFTTEPKRFAKEGDILLSVRAPVGDINISKYDCAIGRGIAGIRSKDGTPSYLFYQLKELYDVMTLSNDEGTIFGSINKDTLFGLPIIIPKIENIKEFERQVSIIDSEIRILSDEVNTISEYLNISLGKL